nr:hypothetical protein [Tessaracoccus coleopterorum]
MSALLMALDQTERAPSSTRMPSSTSSPTGRPCARCTRRSSRASPPDRPRLLARDPGRPAVEPAPAGHRARPREKFEAIENMYEAADKILGRPRR